MSTLRGEERLVTVVFADLTESVRRTTDLSPEEATGLVNPLLEAMVELMMRHGGRIDRFLGDGVLAVFGVPAAHEDDPIRAVRAAVELRERAASLGLAVTVGINTGRVYFGPVGSSLHEELTVMGPTVNLAARLQSAASADEILVGQTTRDHVEKAFHLAPLTLSIKGISDPVTAYRAEYLVDHPETVRGIRGLRAELVGREEEIRTLVTSLDAGRGTFTVVGQAGVGKSRLAAELNQHAAARGMTWMEGRCLELTRHLPYGPFVDLLRRWFGSAAVAKEVIGSFEELVDEGILTPEQASEQGPFLAALLGDELGDERDRRVSTVAPDQRRRLTIRALVDYLVARAQLQPTVVFLEDLHWADDASLLAIEELHRAAQDQALVVVLAYRPDAEAPISGLSSRLHPPVKELQLEELSLEQSKILISRLLAASGLPASLEERIIANAGGNPFYVEEIIRTLIQRGVLVHQSGSWEATGAVEEVPVPESVESLLMSRFDRLPPLLKQAARMASVLDGEIEDSFLAELAGAELAGQMPALVEAGLASVQRTEPTTAYAFLHALTRQAIYSSLLPSQRSELHGRVAATLEKMESRDLDRLAHHHQHGPDHGKAVEYSLAAAEQAMAFYANDTALLHLEAGRARVAELPPESRAGWNARYLARRGELLERKANHEAARTDLLAALDHLDGDPLEKSRIWRLVGQTQRLQQEYDAAHRSYDRAEESLDHLPDRDSVEAHREWIAIQQERSHALYFGGRGRELPGHNARVEPIVERFGTITQQVDLRRAMAMDDFSRYRFALDERTVEHTRHSLRLAEAGADPGRIAETTFVHGFALLWADRVEEAADVLERAVARALRVGDVVHENRARSYLAVALRRVGNVHEAARAATNALELSSSLDDTYYRGHALATLCWVGWRRDDGTCRPFGEEAYAAWGSTDHPDRHGLATEFAWMAVWPLAAEAHRRAEPDEAVTHLHHLLVPWERTLAPGLEEAVNRAISVASLDAIADALAQAGHHRLL